MFLRILLPLAFIAVSAPALAATKCDGNTPGVHISGGFSFGEPYTNEQQRDFDLMELRREGIDAHDVGRTSDGCLLVYRKDEEGKFYIDYLRPEGEGLKLNLDF